MHLLWRYLKEYRKTLFLALFLAATNQIFSLLDPQIFRLIIDNYATRVGDLPQEEFVRGVLVLLLAAMGVAFVSRVAANFQSYYLNVITQRVGAAMYGAGVAHSFSLPYFVFEDQRSGELLQKLQKARTDSQVFITSAVNIGFFSIVGILFVLAYAITIHWLIGLTYFLLIPILGTTAYLVGRRIRTAQKRIVAETAELAGSTTETLRNVELVKSLGLEAQETARLNKVNDRILGFELEKVKMVRKLMFLQGTTINALRSILMFVMLYLMFQGAMTLGQFFSLLFYSFFIFNPLGELGNLSSSYQEASASLEVLGEVLKTPPEPKPVSQKSPGTLRTVEFKKVSFAYASGTAPAVHGVTLSIRPGETIAFVGPSGSGKTTLVKLLVGLYRPTHGHLLINGIDAGSIDYESFRSRVGLVSQETQLFAGTIRENLLFVKPEASDEECMRALRMAAGAGILERARLLAPELQADPPDSLRESKRAGGGQAEQGLDTRIGEGGIKLSGGERQRLAISRALLRDPELIIFDEATSSLDSLTEREITKTIQDVEQANPTVMKVLVAHRLSTIAHAKRIYVLERGKIIEVGSHRELLKKKGLYAALWREQSSAG